MKLLRSLCLLGGATLAACGPIDAFPTGTFMVHFSQTSSTCPFSLVTAAQPMTIDLNAGGTYSVTFLHGQLSVLSANSHHLTLITAPTPTLVQACAYSEVDSLTLNALGQNFTGTVQQLYSVETNAAGCGSCAIQQGLRGERTGD